MTTETKYLYIYRNQNVINTQFNEPPMFLSHELQLLLLLHMGENINIYNHLLGKSRNVREKKRWRTSKLGESKEKTMTNQWKKLTFFPSFSTHKKSDWKTNTKYSYIQLK